MTMQTNRQLSIGGFYFLYFLFLLHVCTAFFTIIGAFNNELDDNEGWEKSFYLKNFKFYSIFSNYSIINGFNSCC